MVIDPRNQSLGYSKAEIPGVHPALEGDSVPYLRNRELFERGNFVLKP
jgi:hypothetical protein